MFHYIAGLLLVTAAWAGAAVVVGLAGTALLVTARCARGSKRLGAGR